MKYTVAFSLMLGVAMGGSLRRTLPESVPKTVDPMDGNLFGGDMMMTKEEIAAVYGNETAEEAEKAGHTDTHSHGDEGNDHRKLGVASKTAARWPGGKVCYYWHSSATSNTRKLIAEAMSEISRYTPISFTQNTASCKGAKVEIGKDFPDRNGGCWANVGAFFDSNQKLQLGSGCETKGTAIHEMLHTLGLHHEHNAPDRDEYVTVYMQNVVDGKESNFKKASLDPNVGNYYDYESIMHYSEKGTSKNGHKTIDCKGWACGQRDYISWGDVYNIRRMYETYKDTIDLIPVEQKGTLWSQTFSEESFLSGRSSGPRGYSGRGRYPAKGLTCSGRYCDNMQIRYAKSEAELDHALNWWSHWFSEENDGHAYCPSGMVVSEIQCRGSYCDDIRFRCDRLKRGYVRSNDISGTVNWFSEEEGSRDCSAGQAIVGIRCRGRYCDGKYFYCAKIYKKSGPGVSLYRDINYVGDSSHFKEGRVPNMGNTAIGNDNLSSISIDRCYSITLYQHDNYGGNARTFTSSVADLHANGWGDTVSSFIINRNC